MSTFTPDQWPKQNDPGARATALYAVIDTDEDGDQGIVTANGLMGPLPLVFMHMTETRMRMLREVAKRVASETNHTTQIVKFGAPEVLETY